VSYQSINQPTNQPTNQSIFIYIRQPKPTVARPNTCKKKKSKQHYTNITTQTDARKEKLQAVIGAIGA